MHQYRVKLFTKIRILPLIIFLLLLGINTTILQSLSIGDYASTGIGTVVTTDLKSNKFMIGNPGRVIR